jgi:hypothetical protein
MKMLYCVHLRAQAAARGEAAAPGTSEMRRADNEGVSDFMHAAPLPCQQA